MDERLEQVVARLRQRGGRITSPRRAILRALVEADEHPTAEQLTTEVQGSHPDVASSTVYRFLDDLERLGVVDHVHLGHGPAVYHFADDLHHHLVCEECRGVVEVPEEVFAELRDRLHREFGFDLHPRHFAVPGRCRRCAGTSRPQP